MLQQLRSHLSPLDSIYQTFTCLHSFWTYSGVEHWKNNLDNFRTLQTFYFRFFPCFRYLARNIWSARIWQACLKCRILARFLQLVSDIYHFCKTLAKNVWEFDWGNKGFTLLLYRYIRHDLFLRPRTSHWKVHRPQTYHRISLDFPTWLKSNLVCFWRQPHLATIVFKAFVVTRQLRGFAFSVFFGVASLFAEIFGCRQCVHLIFGTQLDDEKVPFFSMFWHCETFVQIQFSFGQCLKWALG